MRYDYGIGTAAAIPARMAFFVSERSKTANNTTMSSNYDGSGLPEGMELDEMHEHSDGKTQVDVNAFHGSRMTSGSGSSEEEYPDTEKSDEGESEVGSKGDHNGPERESRDGSPRVSEGATGGY